MISIRKSVQQDIENYSLQREIIEMNILIMNIVGVALRHQTDDLVEVAPDFVKKFATLMYKSHNEDEFTEVIHSIAGDVETVAAVFNPKTTDEVFDMYAKDIGMNSESDTNYTVTARCIATFALMTRMGVEFDFE